MQIILTTHVKTRMSERGISQAQIKDAIASPDVSRDTYPPKKRIRKKFKSKTLELICTFDGNRVIIITAYFL